MPTKTSLCPTFYRLTFKKGKKKLGEKNKRRRKTYEHNNDDLMGITGI